ncbi:phosphate ABC transporter permease [Sporocytophaga myxococcoides]|uniref:Phosphate transport system permease protein PstA n=1 Tax=Sporocytophaga myxococcoides TaxID=153721 RepID=A0A098LD10_9BACT|nr:phosphate ABC transporter permease PstA [Sporocytophaga myxococcoides]GAL84791.1 phosphate ABC transporter permease [Sporocytophaga myxococcoides]
MGKKGKGKIKKRLKYFSNTRVYEYQDQAFKYFGLFCTLIGVVVLMLLLGDVLYRGLSRLDWDFIMGLPSRRAARAGIYTAWVGTLWIMVLTAVIAFPVGISAGLYLEEYNKRSRLSNIIEINIANLAGVPSIIYGLLGLELFARALKLGESVLTGALTLSLLILPIIIVSTREALKAVPYSIREGSYALGASKWQTIWYQVLPAAVSGIFTGVILSLSRAIGETAPLIVIGALTFVPFVPESVMDSFTVLPIQIFNWVSRPQKEFSENAAAAIIILLSITFIMNGIAVYIRHKWQKKVKW